MKQTGIQPALPADFHGRSVYVIDDDADIRRSLNFLLATRRVEVTVFRCASDFLLAVGGLMPSPLIVDVRMPKMDGLQMMEELAQRGVDWPAIFLSGHGDIATAVRALKLGASDFLEKPVVAADLEVCLRKAFETIDNQSAERELKIDARRSWAELTPREIAVFEHLCNGMSNKEVAFQLGISTRTVEMHRANALKQLRVRSLPEVMKLKFQAT